MPAIQRLWEMRTRAVLSVSGYTVHHGNLDSKNGKRLESQKTDLRVFFQNSVNIRNMNLDSKIGKRLEKWKKTRFIGLTPRKEMISEKDL